MTVTTKAGQTTTHTKNNNNSRMQLPSTTANTHSNIHTIFDNNNNNNNEREVRACPYTSDFLLSIREVDKSPTYREGDKCGACKESVKSHK